MRTFVISALLLAACSGGPQPPPQAPGSRGPHASEHLAAARDHEEAARQASMWPDTRTADGTGRADQLLIGTTWNRGQDTARDQQHAAAAHRSEAQAIHAEFEAACVDRTAEEIAVSPIVRYGIGGNPTSDGVVVYLSQGAGSVDKLLADVRCHRAWMRLAPANMEMCPLDLDGLEIAATRDESGLTLTLSVHDRSLIPELQRRAAHDLELGRARRR